MIRDGVRTKSGVVHTLRNSHSILCGIVIPEGKNPKIIAVSDPVFPDCPDPRCPKCLGEMGARGVLGEEA